MVKILLLDKKVSESSFYKIQKMVQISTNGEIFICEGFHIDCQTIGPDGIEKTSPAIGA